VREIKEFGDLPRLWQHRWSELVDAYVGTMGKYKSLHWIEDAAFQDTVKAYVKTMRAIAEKQGKPT
jgi:hypothetical protein